MNKESITTNSEALHYRRYVNENYAKYDFDKWVFNNLGLQSGLRVLDIGCGTGKHLFPIAKIIGNEGLVIGTDISKESLDKCRKINAPNVKICEADLVEIKDKVNMTFDRILSSFSIYFTKDKIKTFNEIYDLLNENGILFICGPAKETNKEYFELVKEAGGSFSEDFLKWCEFLENDAEPILKKLFGKVEVMVLKNPIDFPNPSAFIKYWKSDVLYDKSIERNIEKIIKKRFIHGKFTVTKVILGLRCIKESH